MGAVLHPTSKPSEFVLGVIFRYPATRIDEWFENRLVQSNFTADSPLASDAFWKTLSSVVEAMSVLENIGVYHGQLHFNSILMEGDEARLLFNPAQPTSIELYKENNRWAKLIFLAPEELKEQLSKSGALTSKSGQQRSDVFNCGMIFLRLLMKLAGFQGPSGFESVD